MSLIKHHKKFIALFVVLSFLYLVEISYLPLRAEPAPAKAPVSMNGDDQTPGSIEQEGGGYVHKKKSSPILPIIIGVVVLGAVAAVLILVVFKTKYDITGTWSISFVATNTVKNWSWTYTFVGTKKSGAVSFYAGATFTGTYTVDGKAVHIPITCFAANDLVMDGNFSSKTAMSGTAVLTGLWVGGVHVTNATWTATKSTTTSTSDQQVAKLEKR